MRVQKIRVPDTGHLSWIVVDGEHLPVTVLNEYLLYLHRLGRSPNTVRAYAHHLQAFWAFLVEHGHDWQRLKLTQLAEFVSWVRHATRTGRDHRSDATINLILAAIGSFYEYQDRLGVETAISRSRRYGAKSPYKRFLHHISQTQSLRHAVIRVRAIKRLPRVFSPVEVQSLLDACTRLRDRLLLCLLHESGMRIGQALGLRHADIRSYDGAIDIVPRANSNGALAKSRSPYVVHVSKPAMALYATHPGWKRATQVKLIAELQGFWAEDLWDMHHSPAGTLSPNASQRRLRFDCKSAAINGELKYVCWKKFSGGEWRSTQELTKVHLMIRWLNSLNDLPASLMCLSFPEWQALYRKGNNILDKSI